MNKVKEMIAEYNARKKETLTAILQEVVGQEIVFKIDNGELEYIPGTLQEEDGKFYVNPTRDFQVCLGAQRIIPQYIEDIYIDDDCLNVNFSKGSW